MSKLKIEIDYDFCQWSELSEQDKQLSATAMPTIAISMWARRCSFTMGASSSVPIKRMPHSRQDFVQSVPPYLQHSHKLPSRRLMLSQWRHTTKKPFSTTPSLRAALADKSCSRWRIATSKICASCSMGPPESTFLRASKTSCLSPLSMRICENSAIRLIFYKTL